MIGHHEDLPADSSGIIERNPECIGQHHERAATRYAGCLKQGYYGVRHAKGGIVRFREIVRRGIAQIASDECIEVFGDDPSAYLVPQLYGKGCAGCSGKVLCHGLTRVTVACCPV